MWCEFLFSKYHFVGCRSGVRSNDKREGAGSNNWGSTKEHIQEEEAVVTDDKVSCLFYSYFAVSIILFFVVNICTMNGRSRSL